MAGAEVRRMRRLVVSVHATVANYEYLIYWRFYTDGNIECEVRATGIMVTTPLAAGQPRRPRHAGRRPHLRAVPSALPGRPAGPGRRRAENSVYEVDSRPDVGQDNPYGLALQTRGKSLIASESRSQDYDGAPALLEGHQPNVPTGSAPRSRYKLVPGAAIPPIMAPARRYCARPVIGHTLWVTQYDQTSAGRPGIPDAERARRRHQRWTADDGPMENTDVVLWYVFGIHHITRPEDWPVMPADTVSFWLKPFGFFDRNPALDV